MQYTRFQTLFQNMMRFLTYVDYATSIREMHITEMAIPYTNATSIHYQALSKKDIVWKIDVNNLSVWSLRSSPLLVLDKHDDFANKNEEFYLQSLRKFWWQLMVCLINCMQVT